MTQLGKILVFVNLFLSLLLATLAFGLWSNRIDFSSNAPKGDVPAGEFKRRQDDITALWQGVQTAETALSKDREELVKVTNWRLEDFDWYRVELDKLLTGATAMNPAQQVEYAADDTKGVAAGQILLDANGRPELKRARDPATGEAVSLESLASYQGQDDKLLKDLDDIQKAHERQIDEAIQLTNKLAGEPAEGGRPATKGLQRRLVDERNKREDVIAEFDRIRSLQINSQVDAALVLKRHKALLQRVDELRKTPAVAARDR